MRRSALFVPFLALVACADSDGDGLWNGRENHLGSDPELADTDGDGMNDKDEVKAKCDPTLWDTDGDGYSDFQEIDFGSDPLDIASGVYAGGWPYNPFKDDMEDPGLEGHPSMGEPIGRFVGLDQFGEQVDFYDFAGHDKYVMIDISALWCPPCRELSGWLDGDSMGGMQSYEVVREAVDNGDLLWITLLGEDNQGNYPEGDDIAWWQERFPNPKVALLADSADYAVVDYFNIAFWPSLYLLDEDLQLVRGPSSQSWVPALDEAADVLNAAE